MANLLLKIAAWAAHWLPGSITQALYRSPLLARAIRQGLNRAAPHGLVPVTVAAGELAGAHLWLDMQSEKDYWLGTYEIPLQRALKDFTRPGMVAYDLGANIGYLTLILARMVGDNGSVFAFEALPANLDRLRENLNANVFGNGVVVIPCAVTDQRGEVDFFVGPSGGTGKIEGSAGRQELQYKESIRVGGISLDSFIYGDGNPPPQIMKVDIEGGEVLALAGMKRVLAEARPLILLELHGPQAARAVWEVLSEAGYSIARMERGYPRVSRPAELDWKSYLVASPRHIAASR